MAKKNMLKKAVATAALTIVAGIAAMGFTSHAAEEPSDEVRYGVIETLPDGSQIGSDNIIEEEKSSETSSEETANVVKKENGNTVAVKEETADVVKSDTDTKKDSAVKTDKVNTVESKKQMKKTPATKAVVKAIVNVEKNNKSDMKDETKVKSDMDENEKVVRSEDATTMDSKADKTFRSEDTTTVKSGNVSEDTSSEDAVVSDDTSDAETEDTISDVNAEDKSTDVEKSVEVANIGISDLTLVNEERPVVESESYEDWDDTLFGDFDDSQVIRDEVKSDELPPEPTLEMPEETPQLIPQKRMIVESIPKTVKYDKLKISQKRQSKVIMEKKPEVKADILYPKTGDVSPIQTMTLIMLLSLAVICSVVALKRKVVS